jgi:AcrR family transcriptional regulator
MSTSSTTVGERALEAATAVFSRYGYQRTSMADVAREAGISRAALYLHHKDKAALFQALTERMVEEALAAATQAWRPGAPLAENLKATILAKDLRLFRLLHASAHGAELLAACMSLSHDSVCRLDDGFSSLLAERIAAEPGLDLSSFDGPRGFGESLAAIAGGLKQEARAEADYLTTVDRLCRIVAKAAGQ